MTTALRLPAMVLVLMSGIAAGPLAYGTALLTPLGSLEHRVNTIDLMLLREFDPLRDFQSDVEV